ncbi:MAG: Alkyl hydroperoxide reductase subunit C-like protein [Herbinix sp.]|jgi:peroxiredoxin (alkyl hydroperoxide reductase subunit C)|nr:Alkyl hydroperoxide reductase subunit C-like protein [Herbinix sp.]
MEDRLAYQMPLIGDKAPSFHAITTQGEINFPQDYHGRWVILFSHPADFTPVCTTEFMTFASMMNEFKALGTELVGLSIDAIYSHIAWLRKIRELSWKDIKHIEVTFPLIADLTMDIAKKYGMVHPSSSGTQTVRAVFVIDPEATIRAIIYYPATTGRNMEEIKRLIIALQKSDCENVATPANWMPCDDVIVPAPGTCGAANDRMNHVNENSYCLDWFLCFKQSNCSPCGGSLPEAMPYPSAFSSRLRDHYKR